jgi:hypothetical protein
VNFFEEMHLFLVGGVPLPLMPKRPDEIAFFRKVKYGIVTVAIYEQVDAVS